MITPIIISGGVKNFYDFITPIKKFNVSGGVVGDVCTEKPSI